MRSLSDIVSANLNAVIRYYKKSLDPELFAQILELCQKWERLQCHEWDEPYDPFPERTDIDEKLSHQPTHKLEGHSRKCLAPQHLTNQKYNMLSWEIEDCLKALLKGQEIDLTSEEVFRWYRLNRRKVDAPGAPGKILALYGNQIAPDAQGYLSCPADLKLKKKQRKTITYPGLERIRLPASLLFHWHLEPTRLLHSRYRFNKDWIRDRLAYGFLYHPKSGELLIEPLIHQHNHKLPSPALMDHGNFPVEDYVRGFYLRGEHSVLLTGPDKTGLMDKLGLHEPKLIYDDFEEHMDAYLNRLFQESVDTFIAKEYRWLRRLDESPPPQKELKKIREWARQPVKGFPRETHCAGIGSADEYRMTIEHMAEKYQHSLRYYRNFFSAKPSEKYWEVYYEKEQDPELGYVSVLGGRSGASYFFLKKDPQKKQGEKGKGSGDDERSRNR